ncbi:Regulator of telomere elongation helicase 1 isoform 1 [Schistosoma japonicum]|uniref:Regulator of telomere elongation helicase 1 isoform 1 n=1 Tax=Schistosoma japonicum TaxID=6182 RepID=A0A4Z2CNE5_SCHJA|nr:Regulator of telomere elongation helicase 1 isoform 1 [Schistosoma japonicum]
MPRIVIDGVEIDFPYQPYDCQLEYMTKVLLSLNQGKHAILESPTGTGKTLCLLCASLAWLDKQIRPAELISTIDTKHQSGLGNCLTCDDIGNHDDNKLFRQIHFTNLNKVNNACKIIFASRTHSQLAQAINALKGTVYSNNISVVGSRDQLCLLTEVMSLDSNSAKIYACRMRVQTKTCEYFRNFDSKRDDILANLKLEGIVDIEDLSNFGQKTRCCPYFISRELKTDSRLIFMPYNYLLDSRIRTLYNINLENTAVIFDEAHNIEQVCEDASSVTLSSALLASAIEHVRCVCEVIFNHNIESIETETGDNNHVNSNNNKRKPTVIMNKKELFDMTQPEESAIESLSIEKMITLKGQLIELERLIDELSVPSEGLTKDGSFIFDLLGRAGINHWTNNAIQTIIDEIMSFTNSADSNYHYIVYFSFDFVVSLNDCFMCKPIMFLGEGVGKVYNFGTI